MDFEEANSQVDSLCGALPRDDLRMHKCIKSDISKVMYQMKCMDTYGIGWYFKSRLASVLKTN